MPTIHRWKNETLPPTPETQRDVNVVVEFTKNKRGESIIVGDKQWNSATW